MDNFRVFGVTNCILECSARDRKVDVDLCCETNLLHHSKRSCIELIEKIYFRIYLEAVQTVYSLAKTYLVIFVPISHLINFVIFKVVKDI